VQSPDTSRPGTPGDKSFHTDLREFEALIQVNTLTVKGRSDIRRKSPSSVSLVYTIVSCPYKSVHIVHH
jgi:hypothetical protein